MSDAVVVGLITAAVTGLVGLLAYKVNNRGQANAFTKNLLDRLDKVEDDLETLTTQYAAEQSLRQAAVRLIDRLYEWGARGGKGKPPQPTDELKKYIDPGQYEQDSSAAK